MEATATKEKNTTIDDFEKNVLEPHQKEINKSIDDFFEEQKVEFSGSPESHESFEKIREFSLSPGKRVRSLLAIEGYKACGGNDIYAIKRLSVSFEILHNYLLVHDDIMDKDKLRRGKPTVQHGYELDLIKKNLETELIEHTGNSLAIIDGDILAALAQLPILDSPFAYELKEKVQREQIKTILNTGFGQKLDVLSTITMPSMEQLLYTHKLKTADYTVVNPLISGAILAGASDEEITVLKEYGYNTGMAFQLKDDELGLSPESLNKDKNDISEGKNTLIIINYQIVSKQNTVKQVSFKHIIY